LFENTNTIVLKLTRDCNLRCDYCYLKEKDLYRGEKMDFNLYKKIIDRIIKDRILSNPDNPISITFHGGEPTMVGVDLLSNMLQYAYSNAKRFGVAMTFSIQTNATLINDDMMALFKQYDVSIGTSFDGVGKANTGRTSTIKTNSFKRIFEKAKKFNMTMGSLIVANSKNIKHIAKTQDFLKKNNIGFKVNYVEDVSNIESTIEVTPKDFLDNVIKPNFKKYLDLKENKRFIDGNIDFYVKSYVESLLFDVNKNCYGNCYIKFCGSGVRVLDINPDGKMMMCGRYSGEEGLAYNGSVLEKDFLSVNQIRRHIEMNQRKDSEIVRLKCDSCYADAICDHGCAAFAYEKYGVQKIREELVCEIFKPMYMLFSENEKTLLKVWAERELERNGACKIKNKLRILGERKTSARDYLHRIGYSTEIKTEENGEVYADLKRMNK